MCNRTCKIVPLGLLAADMRLLETIYPDRFVPAVDCRDAVDRDGLLLE
jgi:hypothetical protein